MIYLSIVIALSLMFLIFCIVVAFLPDITKYINETKELIEDWKNKE